MIKWSLGKYHELSGRYPAHAKIMRFLISGGSAAFTNLGLLYVFTDLCKIWYILSAVMAFIVAFIVSFSLQKLWVFGDRSTQDMHRQLVIYLIVALINLGLNTLFLYALVEYAHVHYLIAQVITSAALAFESFFAYKFLIFKKPPVQLS